MGQPLMPAMQVGNEFLTAKPKISKMKVEVIAPEASLPPQRLAVAVASAPVSHAQTTAPELDFTGITLDDRDDQPEATNHFSQSTGFIHDSLHFAGRYRVASIALVTLVFGAAIITLAGRYWSATYTAQHASTGTVRPAHPIAGLNITVPAAELQSKIQAITNQPATLTVGPYSEQLNSDIIKSWLQISANKQRTEYYIHVNEATIGTSLINEANQYARTPVNQVTVNEDGTSVVAVAGQNGRSLTDPNSLKDASKGAAKNVLAASGLQFSTPLQTAPFQALTAANFDKLLVANVTAKKMWAFQNGQQVNSFLVSAGAPATPTPIGEFHVYAKFSVQDMSGFNPNGTKYFQPKVPWVSYFYQGSAIHGVYWHPLSWFGNINSSHGCVGLPVDQAQWVYNWDSIGTTVITHA